MSKVTLVMLVVLVWIALTLILGLAAQWVLAFFGVHVPLVVVIVGITVVRAVFPSRSST
jgi:hypothetical protein